MDHPFRELFDGSERRIIGLMSGTSLDGIDVADVRISNTGSQLSWRMEGFYSTAYSSGVRDILLRIASARNTSITEVTLLGDLLASEFEQGIRAALTAWGSSPGDYDAIGLHGQTICHQPDPTEWAGHSVTGTFQAGDPSILANRLGLPVVGDFRAADMALGGQGAPLVPYFDFVTFLDEKESRMLVNLGGIANVTVLPRGGILPVVQAFDTGPANMVLDALAEIFLHAAFDKNGETASAGVVHDILLEELLCNPFFKKKPPRSTGRGLFSSDYVHAMITRAGELGISTNDLFATAAALTADSILMAWERFVKSDVQVDRVLVSGGGVLNRTVMSRLRNGFHPVPFHTTHKYGVDPKAKEAICFAVLAHETLNGVATSLPGVTGASRSTILGKICLPARNTLRVTAK